MSDTSTSIILRWIAAANAGQVKQLVALYADNAILLPTFSPRILRTAADRQQYFERLAAQKNMQVSLHGKTLHVQQLDGGLESASGIYRFIFEIDDEPLTFEARFTYVLDPALPAPIITHHSSQIPRNLS